MITPDIMILGPSGAPERLPQGDRPSTTDDGGLEARISRWVRSCLAHKGVHAGQARRSRARRSALSKCPTAPHAPLTPLECTRMVRAENRRVDAQGKSRLVR
jgi:hypothetical protein